MRCVVSCGGTSFPWLVFFFGALLWGSMIHKHTGRWMWQGSASVVSWSLFTLSVPIIWAVLIYIKRLESFIQLNTLRSKTLNSNFARVETFLISRPKLLFVWLILQRISQKRISGISATSNMFSSSHTRISRSQASLFHFWTPPDF